MYKKLLVLLIWIATQNAHCFLKIAKVGGASNSRETPPSAELSSSCCLSYFELMGHSGKLG